MCTRKCLEGPECLKAKMSEGLGVSIPDVVEPVVSNYQGAFKPKCIEKVEMSIGRTVKL